MTEGLKPDCFNCQRWPRLGPQGWFCDAFSLIPVEVLSRAHRHTTPMAGDGGLRFEAKKTQAAAGYEAVSTHQPEECRGCRLFIPGTSCRIVAGEISPLGWCAGFESAGGQVARHDAQEDELAAALDAFLAVYRHDAVEQLPAAPVAAAGVMFVTRGGRVLMLRRADTGLWAFPGGHVEEGETAEEAALRECQEEIGQRPESVQLLTRRIADGVDFTTFMSVVPDEFAPILEGEHTDYRWLPIEDLASASVRVLRL